MRPHTGRSVNRLADRALNTMAVPAETAPTQTNPTEGVFQERKSKSWGATEVTNELFAVGWTGVGNPTDPK